LLIVIFGFLAFSVDVGYIALTKGQLEIASDAGARAAAYELKAGLGTKPPKTQSEAASSSKTAGVQVAAANRAGDYESVFANSNRDFRFGQVTYDPGSGAWNKQWGVAPYNMVELTLHRDQVPAADADGNQQSTGDEQLPLFFAPMIGHKLANVSTKAVSALLPGNGIRIPTGVNKKADILPLAMDKPTWDALMAKNPNYGFQDNFTRNPDTKAVTQAPDGVWEANLYPDNDTSLPSGNRGTVNIGLGNNSTSEISRQIREGLNQADLAFYPNNSIVPPISFTGDTGISAGFKPELDLIKGQTKLIPIFDTVAGNGTNAIFHVIKFVPVTIVKVQMTTNPKSVIVQPATYFSEFVIQDKTGAPIQGDTYFTLPALIQ
jgi:hypothetical protein